MYKEGGKIKTKKGNKNYSKLKIRQFEKNKGNFEGRNKYLFNLHKTN